jgi:glutathione S-transferase
MKLYYHPLSPYCRKVLVAAYEKKVQLERELVNIFDPEEQAKYKKTVYPFGKVPYLVLDAGWKIPESSIIMEYLDTHYDTGPQLIPSDKDLARQARFFDRIGDLLLIEPVGTVMMQTMFTPEDKRDQATIDRCNATIDLFLTEANNHLENRKFVLDLGFSFADISVSSGLNMAVQMGIPLSDYPNVKTWFDSVNSRPSWQRIHAESAPFLEQMLGGT